MTSATRPAASLKRIVILSAAIVAVAAGAGAPGLHAQNAQALEAQHRRLLPLFELAPVVFTDADDETGRLVVGVMDRGAEALVRARLAGLGVTSASVDVVETEPIERVVTLRDKVRPVTAGLQIRFTHFLCSLGFSATRDGVAGFVTAAHCSSRQGELDGTLYYQPLNEVPDEFIGTEAADPAFFRDANGCPRGRRCRYSDSNFSAGANGVPFTLGGIARTSGPNNGSLEIVGGFAISGEASAAVGDTANKVGRTTGWTNGTVTRTCVNTGVSASNIVLLCQDFVENTVPIVQGGDSGSPVFTIRPNGSARLLGNLWGGNGSGTLFVYSPIANIEFELGALTTF
jgi:hypothetical protein